MGAALSDWVGRGYRNLPAGEPSVVNLQSWRFWAGGPGKHTFVCGVVKDSSDSIGRPYPLLLLGMGPLKNWEIHWHRSPYVCEKTWSQMESISTRMFRGLGELEDEVRRVKPPESDWIGTDRIQEEFSLLKDSKQQTGSIDVDAIAKRAAGISSEAEIFIPMDEYHFQQHETAIHVWLECLKQSSQDPPKTVFMGGNQYRTFLALFWRPLSANDFVRIWSACDNENRSS